MDIEGNLILNIMKYIIASAGLVVALVWWLVTRKFRQSAYKVLFWMVFCIGIYWAFYYVQSILGGFVVPHQIWVRAPILLSLGLFIGLGIALLKEMKP